MLGLYAGHWAALGLYVLAIYLSWSTFRSISELPKDYRFPFVCLTLSVSVVSLLFMVLQTDWIINNHMESVGDTTTYLWLVFDIVNGIVYISTLACIKVCVSLYGKAKKKITELEIDNTIKHDQLINLKERITNDN